MAMGGQLGVGPTLEPVRRFGVHPERSRRPTDAQGVEVGGLEQNVDGVVADLGVGAAHDAGESDNVIVVGNHRHARFEFPRLTIEGDHGLPGGRPAGDELRAPDLGQVIGVERLSEFEHHVVGDIDDGADRSNTGVHQATLHPLGRIRLRHTADHTGTEPGAHAGVGDLNRRQISRSLETLIEVAFEGLESGACGHRRLAGEPPVVHGVGPRWL